jgi:hypothetical protein
MCRDVRFETSSGRGGTVVSASRRVAGPDHSASRPPAPEGGFATGTFRDPHGHVGTFAGAYRLERLVHEHGQLAAAGVFSGQLTDRSGRHLGSASRRLTAAAELVTAPTGSELRIGPLDVNLLGMFVQVEEVAVPVSDALAADTPETGGSNVLVLPLTRRRGRSGGRGASGRAER